MRQRISLLIIILSFLFIQGYSNHAKPDPAPGISKGTATYIYITNTSKKYHRSTCRYLKKSKIKITLAEAKRRGLTPSKVCKP